MDTASELAEKARYWIKQAKAWQRKARTATTQQARTYAEASVRACQTIAARAVLIAYALQQSSPR